MTMKELAELAGVSSSAVSRYLNGGSLSQEKRDRIRRAIDETGYQPDPAAQMLRTGTTKHVALIIPKLDSEAVSRVTRGISTKLIEKGYLSVLADTSNDPEKEIA
ncbi:MAG: LacI family transcriptional regulator, partial [Lachnospiraceae bacterium]|nr:LacI family transcriptional regulator [Lachnospiraceae bacterium]